MFPRRLFFFIVLFILSTWAEGFSTTLQVHFINVGQGDSIFILTPSGKKVLVDAGNHPGADDPKNPFHYLLSLKEKGKINDLLIDLAIITHPHEDHYGGFQYLCESGDHQPDFFIAHFYFSVDELGPYGKFAKCLENLAMRAQTFGSISVRGPPIDLGDGVEFTVLYPLEPVEKAARDRNRDSVVIRIRYGKVAFLLTGDAPSEIERELLGEEIASQVLKLGHHGSRTSSTPEFLKRVWEGSKTFYAVISADATDGKGKTYGHPHAETLERLRGMKGIRLYRTDKHGHIVFTTDGKRIQVRTEKKVLFPWELWEPGGISSESIGAPPASAVHFPEEASTP